MTKKEILEMTGLSEEEFYRQYPTEESWTESYKKGGWIQKATASIKRRGTEGKCTPMSKPGCTGRALALAKTFHKMAAKRKKKEDGGYVDMYGEGGNTNPPYIAPRESTNTVFTPYQKSDPNAKSQYFRDPFFDYAGSIALGLSPLDTPADIISAISDLKNQRYDDLAFSSAAAYIPGISGLTLKTLYSDAKPYIQEKVYEYYKSKRDKKKKDGGTVDVYQLMGMPTPEMYEPGGKVRRRYKSPDRTDDNLSVIRSKSTDTLNLPDEYAASYDPNSLNLGIVDAKRYNRALGLDYNKSFGPFTAGIRGGVNKETTPTLYQKKGTRYEKVKEGEAKNVLFGGLYGRVGTSIAPDLDTNTEVISFNPSLEVGLDKYGNSTKPYYDASVDVGFLNNMGSIGGGYTNRRQPYTVSLPSEGAGQESYPYAGASLNVPIVRDREGNPRLTVAGGYNIPLSKNTPDSGYAGLTYGFGKGGLIKRKDGSYSRRGLWDNIRANRGSGKKPTAEMLKQERKIRAAEKKEYGGMVNMYGMGGTTNMSHVISAKNFPNMGYAMGGQVNYPQGLRKNMGNMPIFAMGGMTGAPTDINVEKGELLIDPKTGKILTEYKGGGMVPHPEYGMDERGTVPAQEGKFVIPVKYRMGGMTYAKRYKKARQENDKDLMNALINNTAYRKANLEAKEEAEASKMMAKYGGAIQRMMARGGMVPMYQDGNTVIGPQLFSQMYPGGMFPNQVPYMIEQEENWGGNMTNPVTEFGNYLSTQRGQPRNIASMQPSMQSRGISQVPISPIDMSPKQGPYTGPGSKLYINTGMPIETFDVSNITGLDPGQYPNRVPYRVESGETWRGMAEGKGKGTGTGARKGMNNWGQYLPMITSLGMGLEAALQKPFNMNPEDYKIKGKLSSYDTPYQTDYRPYALTKYNLRQVGNAGPAGYTALYNAFAAQEAKNKLANRETNLARKMQADQVNLGIEGQNINTAMQIAISNEQNRAARRNAMREQFGKNLPASFYNQQANQITMQALKAAHPDYNFDFGIFG